MPNTATPHHSTRRISWDLLRVIAIVSVVLGHVTHQGALLHGELTGYPFRVPAQFGAAGLMVISAYFVCVSVRKPDTGRWLWSRVARLVPAYLVAVLVTYVVTRYAAIHFSGLPTPDGVTGFLFGVPQGPPADPFPWYIPTWQDLLTNLGMIQAWDYYGFHYLDGSWWTLPVQLFAFCAAAWLFLRRWRTDRVMMWLVWVLMVASAVVRFLIFDPGRTPIQVVNVFFGLGLQRTHLFAMGIALWLWSRKRLESWHLGLLAAACILVQDLHVFPFHRAMPQDPARWPSTIGFAALLLMICLAARGSDWRFPGLARVAPALTWLAGISYGLYLVHQELGYVLARALLDIGVPGWLRLPAVLAAAVLAGWALTAWVERPLHRRLTARRAGKPAQEPVKAQVEEPEPVSVGGAS
ncbi:acyltransferase [Amycolatopsis sp. NPDC051373]|uniref:acyltransferase family protein n=1 Tax=Amycolatopsis sp. NPDC051373 TaxID=3155801 RepID=UPI00344CA87C